MATCELLFSDPTYGLDSKLSFHYWGSLKPSGTSKTKIDFTNELITFFGLNNT